MFTDDMDMEHTVTNKIIDKCHVCYNAIEDLDTHFNNCHLQSVVNESKTVNVRIKSDLKMETCLVLRYWTSRWTYW